jgi:Cu(I)/Ag(I) efflux system membrane protein CusA/SilA
MVPMAIPSFGGMLATLITAFIVPVIYCWLREAGLRWGVSPAEEDPGE